MATRLTQIVPFVAVAGGATVSLPHSLNVNGVAKTPDVVFSDTPGFTVTASTTQVSVTNNGSAPTSVNVWLEYKHSLLREFGAAQTTSLTPNPFVAASGSAGGGGSPLAANTVFAWKVGTLWADVYTAMSAVSGPKICLVERDLAGPRAMTNNGGVPQDLHDVLFMGIGGWSTDEETTRIAVAAGFKLGVVVDSQGQRAMLTSKDLSWDFSALTAPAYTSPNDFNDRAIFTLQGGRLAGPAAAGIAVVDGQLQCSLDDVFFEGGGHLLFVRNFGFSTYYLKNGSKNIPTTLGDTIGNISVYADATCEFTTGGLPGGSVVNRPINNMAVGDDGNSYWITVVGGVVTATLM